MERQSTHGAKGVTTSVAKRIPASVKCIPASVMMPSLIQLRDTAIDAAHASGRVLMRRFRTKLRIDEKPGAGIVTNADFESERVALKILRGAFPSFGVLTEESGSMEAKSPGCWILDPLDGTTNYARGLPTFCVTIAAEWNDEVVVGVTHQPVSGEIYTAIRGKGAFVNGRRMRVSSTKVLGDSFLSTGFTNRKGDALTKELITFERLSRMTQGIRRPGSAALDLAHVARGVFDGYWERGLSPWDVAAGMLLVKEAGGKVTDFGGGAFRLDAGEILSSNGMLHRNLLQKMV